MRPKQIFAAGIGFLGMAALIAFAAPARAEEPSGCDKFKWPVLREQAALAAPDKKAVADGGSLAAGKAVVVHLGPVDKAHFTLAPQRTPAPDSYAATIILPAQPSGVYTLSLSAGAWIDVIQDGVAQKPLGFSGVRDCPAIHKSLKFQLAPQEATIQISNVATPEVSLVVMPQ